MKNKIGKSVFIWLCLAVLCSSVVKAEDAFVVEEEAVIETQESVTESTPPVSVQPQPPALPKEPSAQTENQGKNIVRKEVPEKSQETVQKIVQEESETVSQNTPSPVFKVPVRKKTKESEKTYKVQETETGAETEIETKLPEEEPRQEQKEAPLWMVAVSGIFMVAGIGGIVYRLLIRYGKL